MGTLEIACSDTWIAHHIIGGLLDYCIVCVVMNDKQLVHMSCLCRLFCELKWVLLWHFYLSRLLSRLVLFLHTEWCIRKLAELKCDSLMFLLKNCDSLTFNRLKWIEVTITNVLLSVIIEYKLVIIKIIIWPN